MPHRCCQGCQQQGGLRGKPLLCSLGPPYSTCIALSVLFVLNAVEMQLSSKKPEEEEGRPSSYPTLNPLPLSALAWALQGSSSPGHSLFSLPLAVLSAKLLAPRWGGTLGSCSPGSPRPMGKAGGQRGEQGAAPGTASPPPPPRVIGADPPGSPADGRLVWGPGDLPWFLQLLLTHFCSICSHPPRPAPACPPSRSPPGPEGCRCGHQQGLYFFFGGEKGSCQGDSILLQHGSHGFHGNPFCPNYPTTATSFNLPLIFAF